MAPRLRALTDPDHCAKALADMDSNHDGLLSLEELLRFAEQVASTPVTPKPKPQPVVVVAAAVAAPAPAPAAKTSKKAAATTKKKKQKGKKAAAAALTAAAPPPVAVAVAAQAEVAAAAADPGTVQISKQPIAATAQAGAGAGKFKAIMSKGAFKAKLHALYALHNPEKATDEHVEFLANRYAGQEEAVFDKIKSKYSSGGEEGGDSKAE